MSRRAYIAALAGASLGALVILSSACATAPKTKAERSALLNDADATLATMTAESPRLNDLVERAHGYVVFPSIGKGGVLVGGAYGRGVVYERAQPIGYAEMNQASFGAQLGGQTFSEIVVFETAGDLEELKDGRFSLGAGAGVVVLKEGAARGLEFQDGVAVAIKPIGGLMVDVSVSGQQMNFETIGAATVR